MPLADCSRLGLAILGLFASLGWSCGQTLELKGLLPGPSGTMVSWEASGLSNVAFVVQWQDAFGEGLWRVPFPFSPLPSPAGQWLDPNATNRSGFYRVLAVPASQRGKLLLAAPGATYTTNQLSFFFRLAKIPVIPLYPVRPLKIVYETVTPLGARTIASGALLLPEGTGKALPMVSYQHGTIVQTNQAPSAMSLYTEFAVGVAFATSGYAACVPDYLGLGDTPGFHPYLHARSEATACLDMLRSSRDYCGQNGFPLTNKLFLCGYSQGGHATMALLREIETHHAAELEVTACAPMAGPYDLSGVTASNFLSGVAQPNPYYFLYFLAAFQDVYRLAPGLADLLRPPYNTTLPPLLNGSISSDIINTNLPSDPVQILKPEYLEAFRADPRHPLRLALLDNDVYRWTPRAPMRLYHCAGDHDVIIANSQVAFASFQSLGKTNIAFIDPLPATNHVGCSQPSLFDAKVWFDSLL
jgi:hypothetical protein